MYFCERDGSRLSSVKGDIFNCERCGCYYRVSNGQPYVLNVKELLQRGLKRF